MTDFDPSMYPEPGESAEHHEHRLLEEVLAEDWRNRFSAHGASFRALGDELKGTQEPDKILDLTIHRGESLVRGLGAGALSLWKDETIAERQQFETEFGQDISE